MTEHEYADEPLTEHEVLENLRPQGNVHVLTPEEAEQEHEQDSGVRHHHVSRGSLRLDVQRSLTPEELRAYERAE